MFNQNNTEHQHHIKCATFTLKNEDSIAQRSVDFDMEKPYFKMDETVN